jgi:hypothetical protein
MRRLARSLDTAVRACYAIPAREIVLNLLRVLVYAGLIVTGIGVCIELLFKK